MVKQKLLGVAFRSTVESLELYRSKFGSIYTHIAPFQALAATFSWIIIFLVFVFQVRAEMHGRTALHLGGPQGPGPGYPVMEK